MSRKDLLKQTDSEALPSPSAKRAAYTLKELLIGITPKAMHEVFDWGLDVGREKVD